MSKKVYKKKKIHNALYVIECPVCHTWIASASEYGMLPEFSTCHICNHKKKL